MGPAESREGCASGREQGQGPALGGSLLGFPQNSLSWRAQVMKGFSESRKDVPLVGWGCHEESRSQKALPMG